MSQSVPSDNGGKGKGVSQEWHCFKPDLGIKEWPEIRWFC